MAQRRSIQWRAIILQPIKRVSVLLVLVPMFDGSVGTSMFARPALADPPKVISLTPEHGAVDVDPATTELRIVFDRDMVTGQQSICGGGPAFPELIGKPEWKDARTLVMRVKLKADHTYQMSLNCPASGRYFRSADGEELAFLPWSFSTAAKRSPKVQRELNEKSLKSLMTALKDHYSYYDRKGVDWAAQAKKHRQKITGAKSTQAWIRRVAKMLELAEDPHLWMSYGGATTGTYQRNYKSNFDLKAVEKELGPLEKRNANTLIATTEDNFGYILIPSWSHDRKADVEELERMLDGLKDRKGLIIDVRPNGGGDELLARSIAAWFVKGKKVYSKNCYRDPKAKNGFGEVYDRVIEGNPKSRRYEGPVVVLMGPANLSSCESFLLMMKQGKNVTLMGTKSGGSSGNPKPFELENGVMLYVPSWKDMLPDGSPLEGAGCGGQSERKIVQER